MRSRQSAAGCVIARPPARRGLMKLMYRADRIVVMNKGMIEQIGIPAGSTPTQPASSSITVGRDHGQPSGLAARQRIVFHANRWHRAITTAVVGLPMID